MPFLDYYFLHVTKCRSSVGDKKVHGKCSTYVSWGDYLKQLLFHISALLLLFLLLVCFMTCYVLLYIQPLSCYKQIPLLFVRRVFLSRISFLTFCSTYAFCGKETIKHFVLQLFSVTNKRLNHFFYHSYMIKVQYITLSCFNRFWWNLSD